MTVFLRVHPDPTNYDVFDYASWLFDTRLNEVQPEDLAGNDVLFRMTPEQFERFDGLTPDGMFFRVYENKGDTNPNNGVFYDLEFRQVKYADIPKSGIFIIIPATNDEFATFKTLGTLNHE